MVPLTLAGREGEGSPSAPPPFEPWLAENNTKVLYLTLFYVSDSECDYHGALVVPISIMIASSILVGRP